MMLGNSRIELRYTMHWLHSPSSAHYFVAAAADANANTDAAAAATIADAAAANHRCDRQHFCRYYQPHHNRNLLLLLPPPPPPLPMVLRSTFEIMGSAI